MLCAVALAACGQGGAEPALNENEVISIVDVTDSTNDDCRYWNANLSACKPYRCVYMDADGTVMGREIEGVQNGRCVYREQLAADKALQCALPSGNLQDMAQYYRMVQLQEDVELSVMQLADGSIVYQEIIDGKPVRTPLQKALSSGACRIQRVAASGGNVEYLDLQFGDGKDTENIIL